MDDYSNLAAQLNFDSDCHYLDCIPSTNDYLTALAFSPKIQVCVTAEQTQGKGQHNREWLSNKNSSILLSIRRVFSTDIQLSGLSLVVGLAIVEVLKDHNITDLMLKWPNDVYYQDKKLAGILIENSIQNQHQSVVIGIGLNVDTEIDCDTPWTNLRAISTQNINRFDLTKDLINKILEFCQIFERKSFACFSQQWQDVDYLQGKQVQYKNNKHSFLGTCLGVDASGVLLVKTKESIIQVYSSEFLTLY
ncbi:Biotin operon repressor / Biotin-protein ligase [uncultured Candidatus Thioglobus sp.]|nr:Biotin operon repressor / Biotin-protein ligase [uncultured Candidatus Thioglobus sp.]